MKKRYSFLLLVLICWMTTIGWGKTTNCFGNSVANKSNHLYKGSGTSTTSSATDYFRTKQSGTWDNTSTWESSPDNSTWANATLTPTNSSMGITILSGHTVTVSSSVTIDKTVVSPNGVLIVNAALIVNNNGLTFKSDATGTASLGSSSGSINGKVTVERYIPAHATRAYTLVAPSVNNTTMYNSWQEGGASTVGYGTQISGMYAGNGFDFASTTGTASVFDYNDEQPTGSKWESLGTGTYPGYGPQSVPFYSGQGWLLFVRGDRTVGAGSGLPGATTLRSTGYVTSGSVDFINLLDPNANKFTLIGNPYPCAIKWSTTSKTALSGSFTVYDPNLLAFVTSNGVTVSPSASHQQANVIQSGQAFFVKTDGSGSQPDFLTNESDKITTASTSTSNTVFRSAAQTTQLNINVYKGTAAHQTGFADGAVAIFGDKYSAVVGKEDASKFTNFNETIALFRDNKALSIEGRPLTTSTDTLFISTQNMGKSNYNFSIDATGFTTANTATLIDNYKDVKQTLDLTKVNNYDFAVNADAASYATGRFMIVLGSTAKLALVAGVSVRLSPNPVKDQLLVNFNIDGTETKTIRVTNSLGQLVLAKSVGNAETGSIVINTNELTAGTYIVEVMKGNNRVFTQQIVK